LCGSFISSPPAEAEESTVIARGTSVYGDMRSEGGIQFGGILKGDLAAAGDIVLSGRILGNVSGRNIRILGGAVQGDVAAAGTVETDENAVVIGDVTAEALTANGRQKGSVRVEKTLRLGEKAVLAGDVTAMQITMAEGAKVQLGVVVSRSGEGFPAFAELEI
jgi:cytoskeletal protein CcmA (bactofilin family)